MLFPDDHIGRALERAGRDLLGGTIAFERRADDERSAFAWEQQRQQALAESPIDAGEIPQRGPPRQQQGIELLRGQQLTRSVQSGGTLFQGDRPGAGLHRAQRPNGGR